MSEEDKKTEELSKLSREIPNLIRDIEKIKSKRDGIIDATKDKFNVFTILLQAHDEVRLHTRFITAMLDGSKNASHGCGTLFLKLFLEILDNRPPTRFPAKDVNVEPNPIFKSLLNNDKIFKSIHKEYHTGDKGNIDILIKFNDAMLAIENKINAKEQEDQLLCYSEYLNRHKSENNLFFLTLRGHDAVSNSDKLYWKISYQDAFIPWLDTCLEKTYRYPNINSVISQYKKVVQQLLSNNSFEEEDMKEIKKLIEKNPLIVKYLSEIEKCTKEVTEECKKEFIANLSKNVHGYINNSNYQDKNKYGEDIIGFDITLNNNFLTENDLIQSASVEITDIFSHECLFFWGLSNEKRKKPSVEVVEILEKINSALREQEPDNYDGPNDFWFASCYISRDVLNIEWLCKALADLSLIEKQAKECADKINHYMKIVESTCPNKTNCVAMKYEHAPR